MNQPAIAVHGGAGPVSDNIKKNEAGIEAGLKAALLAGNEILQEGGTALAAVEAAVCTLEDNPLFNAGRGSSINSNAKIEMDASIMDGATLKAGAVAGIYSVKNPVTIAKLVMEKTTHVLLAGAPALDFATANGVRIYPDAYFVTEEQFDEYWQAQQQQNDQQRLIRRIHGTVGAVAVDKEGNVAAATSTGGLPNSLPGRIGDSCLIGSGCYANNKTCAVSGTGDGEFLIRGVIANTIANAMEFSGMNVQQACDFVIQTKNKDCQGDMGVIATDASGRIGLSFNSKRMHRAWLSPGQPMIIRIYR